MTSQDGSVISLNNNFGIPTQDGNGAITDAAGNVWGISGGQVTVNGVIDQTTANVTQLGYKYGSVWWENTDNKWWAKSDPSHAWGPNYGTGWNPLNGSDLNFALGGNYHTGVITGGSMQLQWSQVTAQGINLNYAGLGVSELGTSPFAVNGNSSIYHSGFSVSVTGYPGASAGEFVNNGTAWIAESTVSIGPLTGSGSVVAFESDLKLSGAAPSENIILQSSHLDVGTTGAYPVVNPGLHFIAPINLDQFSSITLENTQATKEIFAQSGPNAADLMLYNGSALVASLHVTGAPYLFASNNPANVLGGGSVHISSHMEAGVVPLSIIPYAAA